MPKTLKPKPLPPMTEARYKQWATQDASIHVTHFRQVLAALEYERQRANAASVALSYETRGRKRRG